MQRCHAVLACQLGPPARRTRARRSPPPCWRRCRYCGQAGIGKWKGHNRQCAAKQAAKAAAKEARAAAAAATAVAASSAPSCHATQAPAE